MNLKNFILLLFSLLPFVLGCNEDDNELSFDSCIVESIQFSENSRLVFRTISGGVIYQLTQEEFTNETTEVVASFRFSFFKDSLVIQNQLQEGVLLYPYLWVNFTDNKPVKVARYFDRSGVLLVSYIDYSNADKIRVDIERVASTSDTLNLGYGEYFLNASGNVSRLIAHARDDNNPNEIVVVDDVQYDYDDVNNPIKEFYLPFFNTTSLVNPAFFSNNNAVSETSSNRLVTYSLTYGIDGALESSISNAGNQAFYQYLNCN